MRRSRVAFQFSEKLLLCQELVLKPHEFKILERKNEFNHEIAWSFNLIFAIFYVKLQTM
jgi:hypothetical protein